MQEAFRPAHSKSSLNHNMKTGHMWNLLWRQNVPVLRKLTEVGIENFQLHEQHSKYKASLDYIVGFYLENNKNK